MQLVGNLRRGFGEHGLPQVQQHVPRRSTFLQDVRDGQACASVNLQRRNYQLTVHTPNGATVSMILLVTLLFTGCATKNAYGSIIQMMSPINPTSLWKLRDYSQEK